MDDPFEPRSHTHTAPQPAAGYPRADAHPEGTLPAVVTTPPAVGPARPDRLARYQIIRELGSGGMGAVYLAFDEMLRRKVAVKVLLPAYAADREARDRFLREARAAAQVKHDNVATIYDVGEDRGTPFMAMEYLRGYSLHAYLKRKQPLTIAQALRVVRETAEGLAAAHAAGLVHRDIKPANLWLEAPNGRVKILDFGLAKPAAGADAAATSAAAPGPGGDDLTVAGVVMGTPAYMSPEQAKGEPVDHRADLFSLGCVLYRLCAGRPPFDRPRSAEVMRAVVEDEPTPIWSVNPEVPADVAALVEKLLAKDPADRPQTAAEVAKALRAAEKAEATREKGDGATRGADAGLNVTSAPVGRDEAPIPSTEVLPPVVRPSARKKKRREKDRGASGPAKVAAVLFLTAAFIVAAAFGISRLRPRPASPQPADNSPPAAKTDTPKPAPAAKAETPTKAETPAPSPSDPPKGEYQGEPPPPPPGWPPPKGPPGKYPPPPPYGGPPGKFPPPK